MRTLGVTLAMSLALCACDRAGQQTSASKLSDPCSPVPTSAIGSRTGNPTSDATQWRLDAESCLKLYGYSLARSPDPAESVAKAAFAKCERVAEGAVLRTWGELSPQLRAEVGGFEQYWEGELEDYHQTALARVVEARAGECWRLLP